MWTGCPVWCVPRDWERWCAPYHAVLAGGCCPPGLSLWLCFGCVVVDATCGCSCYILLTTHAVASCACWVAAGWHGCGHRHPYLDLALHPAADAALGKPSMASAALADPVGVSSVRFLLNRRHQHITCEPASRAEECCSQPEPAPAMWAQPNSSRVGSNGCL